MKEIRHLCMIGIVAFSLKATCSAAVLTYTPTLDGNIRSSGGSGGFTGSNVQIGNTGTPGDLLYGLIQFDLSSIPKTGITIESVTLKLTKNAADGTSADTTVTYQIYESLRDFTSSANYTQYAAGQNWQVAGGTGALDRGNLLSSVSVGSKQPSQTVLQFGNSTNFTNAVSLTIQGDGILSLWVGIQGAQTATQRQVVGFIGTEHATSSFHPVLTINYQAVPEPSACLLLVSAAGAAFTIRRKRRTFLSIFR